MQPIAWKKQGIMFRLLSGNVPLRIAKDVGFDIVFFDLEHGAYDYQSLMEMSTFCQSVGLTPMARVLELARAQVSRALDCGVRGVMVPMLETRKQAMQFVEWAKYPPLGKRGFSSNGGHSAWRKLNDTKSFMAHANEETLAIAQIESATAITNCEAIASTPGIDCLLIGPNDLSISLGIPGEIDSQEVRDSIEIVANACRVHGKMFGIHAGTRLLESFVHLPMNLMINSLDVEVLTSGLRRIHQENVSVLQRMTTA